MKTFTQIVLPIIILAGVVFGITYIKIFSSNPGVSTDENRKAITTVDPLKFNLIVGRKDPTEWHLRYWRNDYELGEDGHYDFWFRNQHDQPVRLAFTGANCQCAAAEAAVLPADDFARYLRTSGVTAMPLPGMPIISALNTAQLAKSVEWTKLEQDGKRLEVTVPAAGPLGPQWGLLRLNWRAKDKEGDRKLSADFIAQLPNATAAKLHFEAVFNVVPPFDVFVPSTASRNLKLGEMGPSSVVGREFIIWSRTRPIMDLKLTPRVSPEQLACVEVLPPVKLTPAELAAFAAKMPDSIGLAGAYRSSVIVHERREKLVDGQMHRKQLDLGPLEFTVKIEEGEDKYMHLPVTGSVKGDVRLVSSDGADRIDFGSSFPSGESRSMQVTVMSERADLELELDRAATMPEFLDAVLTPGTPRDGKNFWTLRVTIPAGKLYGNLQDGFVMLKTKEPTSRRIRIPVKANAYDGGRPF